jgi:DnaJ-class molecular chaperone
VKNPYKVLGVNRSSTDQQVAEAFRAIAWRHHPDRVVRGSDAEQAHHAAVFAEASQAMSLVRTSRDRDVFDSKLGPTYRMCECRGFGATIRTKSIKVRELTTCPTCEGLGRIERSKKA